MSRDGMPMGKSVKATLDWVYNVGPPRQSAILPATPGGKQTKKSKDFLKRQPWTWEEGAKSAPYSSNTDLLLDDELTAAMQVRLMKRSITVTKKQFSKIWQPDFLEDHEFSGRCSNPKGTKGNVTGKGPFNLIVYYEPVKRISVEQAFRSAGCDMSSTPQESVDLESDDQIEMYMTYRHAIGIYGRFLMMENTELEVMRQGGLYGP